MAAGLLVDVMHENARDVTAATLSASCDGASVSTVRPSPSRRQSRMAAV